MIEGIILVRTQLLSVLQEEGLERIPVLGLAYDPSVAEAVETRPVDEPEHDHVVVKELLRGYRLNGRVARAARVAVGAYQGAAGSFVTEPAEDLVGADEVSKEPTVAPPPSLDGAAIDAVLDELLSETPSAEEPLPEPGLPEPAVIPEPSVPEAEIDLLKEVLDEDER